MTNPTIKTAASHPHRYMNAFLWDILRDFLRLGINGWIVCISALIIQLNRLRFSVEEGG